MEWELEADKTEDESQHFSFQRCIWREGKVRVINFAHLPVQPDPKFEERD